MFEPLIEPLDELANRLRLVALGLEVGNQRKGTVLLHGGES